MVQSDFLFSVHNDSLGLWVIAHERHFVLKPVVVRIVVGAVSGLALVPLAIKILLRLIDFSTIGPVAGEPHRALVWPHVA